MPREVVAGFEPTVTEVRIQPLNGGIKGKRKSKKDRLREAAGRAATAPAELAAPEPSRTMEPSELFPFTPRGPGRT